MLLRGLTGSQLCAGRMRNTESDSRAVVLRNLQRDLVGHNFLRYRGRVRSIG
jgi:hypothetical protein